MDAPVDRPPVDGGGVDTQTDGPSDGVAPLTGRRSFVVTATFGPVAGRRHGRRAAGQRASLHDGGRLRSAQPRILGSNGTGGSVRFQPGPPGLYTIARVDHVQPGDRPQPHLPDDRRPASTPWASFTAPARARRCTFRRPPTWAAAPSWRARCRGPGHRAADLAPNLGSQVGPFDFLAVAASEPLPPDTHLTLVYLHGD